MTRHIFRTQISNRQVPITLPYILLTREKFLLPASKWNTTHFIKRPISILPVPPEHSLSKLKRSIHRRLFGKYKKNNLNCVITELRQYLLTKCKPLYKKQYKLVLSELDVNQSLTQPNPPFSMFIDNTHGYLLSQGIHFFFFPMAEWVPLPVLRLQELIRPSGIWSYSATIWLTWIARSCIRLISARTTASADR
jgi:hypothetical protein